MINTKWVSEVYRTKSKESDLFHFQLDMHNFLYIKH